MCDKLLTRDKFRELVFLRDGHRCVVCGETNNLDAHHIIERRLFDDGGYYQNNGVALCPIHHIEAEKTTLSVEELRRLINVSDAKKVLPKHFYDDVDYDKWGNIILSGNRRLKGELFDDLSVQKILKEGNVLETFIKYIKYPRTYHFPFSPGVQKDDRILESTDIFKDKEVIVTIKYDGENTSMYKDYIHARSLDSRHHSSRSWVKNFHSTIKNDIPEEWRICGENLFASHSIEYDNLKSFFYGFSIWNEKNICLSWDDTLEWFSLLGILPVHVLYRGIYDEEKIKTIYSPFIDENECEGFVVRIANSFHYKDFRNSIAKYVREKHIQTHGHWTRSWKPNKVQL
jgi:hypothetical protein